MVDWHSPWGYFTCALSLGVHPLLEALARSDYGLSRQYAVALAGYYGFGNLGDELLAASMVAHLENIGIARERIVVLSADPENTSATLCVPSVNRWDILDVFNVFRKSYSLVFGGGGLFQDSTSLRSCFYYWGLLKLARLAKCRTGVFAQSIGPFRTRVGQWLAHNAIAGCSMRTVRDKRSLEILQDWRLTAQLVPDPVMGLSVSFEREKTDALLVNIRPWPGLLPEKTAQVAARWAAENNLPVIGVALAPEDLNVINSFVSRAILSCKEVHLVRSWQDVQKVWSLGNIAIGMRLHFCMLSLLFGCSTLAVPYDPKVEAFASQWGMAIFNGEDIPSLPWPVVDRHSVEAATKESCQSVEKAWEELKRSASSI